ncbi:MAG: aldo/keto reductase [Thermoprotei archaeon]|nr:MAG: aldo/keto reductase [Thermoprotei archaeon]
MVGEFPIDFEDRKTLGRTGERVSAIGLGTWGIRNYSKAEEVLLHAIELGIDLIDTAEMYGSGMAEVLVGRVVKKAGRDRVFITTKMLPHHLAWKDEVIKAGKASLRRMGVEEADLFLIHWPNPSVSISKQVKNFEALIDEGLTRYIGVSNFDVEDLREAVDSTKKADIVVNQVHYSVVHREYVERYLLPLCIREGISIQAYTPLEKGTVVSHEVVRSVARRLGKTPIQVALNYLISRPKVHAIPKTEDRDHLLEILGALGWRLPREFIKELER